MTMFLAYIHNNVLGTCIACADESHALELVKDRFKFVIGRDMTESEVAEFVNDGTIYNDEDHDNFHSWSIGLVENWG